MKFFILNCGQMITPDNHLMSEFNTDLLKLVIPVPAYLIDHPQKGLVLIDTGFNYQHLPDGMKANIAFSPLLRIKNQIRALGYNPVDVNHVLISHLHFDHAGQMEDFKNAIFHLRQSEWAAALEQLSPDYLSEDLNAVKNCRFSFVPENTDHDLFDDGTIICIDTRGHSAGHQSFLLNLPHTGKILLAADAVHMPQFFDNKEFFAEAWDPERCTLAANKLKAIAGSCTFLVYGHDPVLWKTLKKVPDYYD